MPSGYAYFCKLTYLDCNKYNDFCCFSDFEKQPEIFDNARACVQLNRFGDNVYISACAAPPSGSYVYFRRHRTTDYFQLLI